MGINLDRFHEILRETYIQNGLCPDCLSFKINCRCDIEKSEPTYDPAAHWGEDYFIDEPFEAPHCYACDNTGYSDHGSYFDPPSPCSRCEESRAMFEPEPEEIDYELMGVGL